MYYFCLACETYSLVDAMEFDETFDIGYCPMCGATTDDMVIVDEMNVIAVDIAQSYSNVHCQCEDYPCCGHSRGVE